MVKFGFRVGIRGREPCRDKRLPTSCRHFLTHLGKAGCLKQSLRRGKYLLILNADVNRVERYKMIDMSRKGSDISLG